MNITAKVKIEFISNSLHKLARENCPKFMSTDCQSCDIECPYDTLFTVLSHIKNGDIVTFTTTKKLIADQNAKLGINK